MLHSNEATYDKTIDNIKQWTPIMCTFLYNKHRKATRIMDTNGQKHLFKIDTDRGEMTESNKDGDDREKIIYINTSAQLDRFFK